MSKRIRFLITSFILSLGFIGIQFLPDQFKLIAISGLVILTVVLTVWSLYEGLGKNMTLISLILPMLFTFGVGIFWFLLPANIFTRVPIVIFYAMGIYVLCLTMNIYTVSALRTIALLRAAHGVGFVMTLITAFLLFDAVFSLRQNLIINMILFFVLSFLLLLQGFWAVNLDKKANREVILTTIISSFVISQIGVLIHFWPVTVVVGSLFMTSGVYLLVGLGQAKLEDRLFASVVREYLTVGIIVLAGMFFATRWAG